MPLPHALIPTYRKPSSKISFGGGPTLPLNSSALNFVHSMLENVIRRVRRLLLSGDYVVSEDWPAGNFRRWHSGTTIRSRFRLSNGGLALAFICHLQPAPNRIPLITSIFKSCCTLLMLQFLQEPPCAITTTSGEPLWLVDRAFFGPPKNMCRPSPHVPTPPQFHSPSHLQSSRADVACECSNSRKSRPL